MSTARTYRYPCTGQVRHDGFGEFLERNLGAPRANLNAFARELGQRFDAPRLTLTNSGSSANLAAALALAERTGRGAHAVIAGFTFPTTVSALLFAGFSVSVADVEPGGFCLDPGALAAAIRPSTRVVCATHFLGFPTDPAVFEVAEDRGLFVLQDCCEGMDLRVGGEPAHRRGTLTSFSFYHPHHLSAYGGGAVVSLDEEWQRALESLVHWGRACTCHVGLPCTAPPGTDHNFWYVRPGFNLELSELNACFGRYQLQGWDEQERRRRANYELLFTALADHPKVRVYPAPRGGGSPFVFPITVRGGDAKPLAERLLARGVEVRSLMGGAITEQPAYAGLDTDGLPEALAQARTSFFVGIHQTLPEDDVRAVAEIVAEEAAR